jgi:hypothetical protein
LFYNNLLKLELFKIKNRDKVMNSPAISSIARFFKLEAAGGTLTHDFGSFCHHLRLRRELTTEAAKNSSSPSRSA